MTPDAWGIDDAYVDVEGVWHQTPLETRAAIRAVMGVDVDAPAPPEPPVRVIREGESPGLAGPVELRLEDGTVLDVGAEGPPDLPIGYHELRRPGADRPQRLIVAPPRCHLPDGLRLWGWAVQLYAARSAESWGIGDLGDLRRLAAWSAGLGAGLLLLNPLAAVSPVVPQEASPYYPGSRRYRNPLYLRVEDVPGAREARLDLEPLARAGRELNQVREVDRDAVFRLKMAALERLWVRFPGDPDFDRYRATQGPSLAEFTTFCALAERHGRGFRDWPGAYRRPDASAVAEFAAEAAGRIGFHGWLQWLLDRQLARAGTALRLMHDLPVGMDPSGADAWAWQDVLALEAAVGAPPDRFAPEGQDWGIPPFVPHRLRALAYEPFVQTIRAALRHAGGLRIDHVMGLFRLFWIPRGAPPRGGAYVRYPADDLLAIVALESERARAVIVGEDLGTVEPGVREQLATHGMLSTRLLWFESSPPSRWPAAALAAVTTHDLPTLAGLWTGADLDLQRTAGLAVDETGLLAMRDRLATRLGVPADAPVSDVIERAHRHLGEAPCAIVLGTLEDALAVEERPNLPGTTRERRNWSLALPLPLEAIPSAPLPRAVAAALGGPGGPGRR
jgi:4-alpha-glucanotransferase